MISSTKLVSRIKKQNKTKQNKREINQGENCLLDIIWWQILQNNGFLTYVILAGNESKQTVILRRICWKNQEVASSIIFLVNCVPILHAH